jgi:hypothetical protein
MKQCIRELVHELLQDLASLPISDVIGEERNGRRANPFSEASADLGSFSTLDDLKLHVDSFLQNTSREEREDSDIVAEICSVLRRKFTKRFSFLALLDSGRFQDAIFQVERRLLPGVDPEHINAIRAKRKYGWHRESKPPKLAPDTDSAEPRPIDDFQLSLIRAKEKARGELWQSSHVGSSAGETDDGGLIEGPGRNEFDENME